MLAQKDDAHFTIFKKRRCFLVNNQYFQLDIYQEPSHPRLVIIIIILLFISYSSAPIDLKLACSKFISTELFLVTSNMISNSFKIITTSTIK